MPSADKRLISRMCLIVLLTQFLIVSLVGGQTSPHATYECITSVDTSGNGSVSVVYSVFAGDQTLQIHQEDVYFPVYNHSAIRQDTVAVEDNYGKELDWHWSSFNTFLIVRIGSQDIPAGGKYETMISYSQDFLSRIVDEEHYFVYEWDFSKIAYSPYTLTEYVLNVQRPANTIFDTYPIDYIGVSPANLNNYITESESTVTLSYSFSALDVTMNLYYRHEDQIPLFIILTSASFVLSLSLALFLIFGRRRRGLLR